jgi:amino acid adenylation domain-containing protein
MTLAEPLRATGTVTAILDEAVRRAPDAPAVRDAEGVWTYAELDAAADAVARHLVDAGVRPGDRVALRSRNRRELPAVLFGTLRAGAALVPLSPHLTRAGTEGVLADAEAAAVVGDADLPGRVLSLPDVVVGGVGGPVTEPAPEDLALLIYTSGSTSAPKGVVEPHAAVAFAARAIAARLGYRADDVVLVGSPMSFDYGLYQVLLAALAGAELVLTDADDPIGMLRAIRDTGATVLPIVPSIGRMLVRLARRGAAIEHVRMFTNTGAALTAADIDDLRATFPGSAVVAMYGITECKRVTIAEPDADRTRPGSVGTALPGTTVQILDDDGTPVGPGVVGQIAAVGPHVMAGYRGAPELTAQRFDVDPETGRPRLRTGDYGLLDAEGHLWFHGRRDDQFKRRGVRMSTLEIEAAAAAVPGVGAAAALVPDAAHDLAVVVTGTREPQEVLDAIAELLEPAKVPAVCHVVEALPLTPNGKTDARRLRALVQQGDPA